MHALCIGVLAANIAAATAVLAVCWLLQRCIVAVHTAAAAVLCCAVLCCAVLCCAVLCCAVLPVCLHVVLFLMQCNCLHDCCINTYKMQPLSKIAASA